MRTVWRCIIDEPLDGAANMARDQAILHAVQGGFAPPTLRLYRWKRATASLGRFQDIGGVDLDVCERQSVDVVRRPTGGRGVLHDCEVTYSMAARLADGVPHGVAASYRFLSAAVAEAHARLGVAAELTRGSQRGERTAACYLQSTQADLAVGARKLSGSAQVWERDAVLQHGSFVIYRDAALEAAVFRLDPEAARRLAGATLTLAEALGRKPSAEEISASARSAVEDVFGVTLVDGSLTRSEREQERELLRSFDARRVTA